MKLSKLECELANALCEMVLQHCDPGKTEFEPEKGYDIYGCFLNSNQDAIHILDRIGCIQIVSGRDTRGVKAKFIQWPETLSPSEK